MSQLVRTLPAFTLTQVGRAHLFLATRVAEMGGRKLEEGDWSAVYAEAKGIPLARWSNLGIDVAHGNLGIEHKMMCRPSTRPILEACGSWLMHPSATRAFRVPNEADPTLAAKDILGQFQSRIDNHAREVGTLSAYHQGDLDRASALLKLSELGIGRAKALELLTEDPTAVEYASAEPDMRNGWLLWQDSLREFLYFEVRMFVPDLDSIEARWNVRPDGRRRGSRNLWIYDRQSGQKLYSVTTDAGAKIQPYFQVPLPNDPNLYHFVVQGEDAGSGMIRAWVTSLTASLLQERLGDLSPDKLAAAARRAVPPERAAMEGKSAFEPAATPLVISAEAYDQLKSKFQAVNDEHLFRQFLDHLPA